MALAPSSRFPPKSWPHANWVALARGLAADGAQVFAVAPPGDTQGVPRMAVESGGALAVIPARDLAFLAALYARASLVVADCSGPRHLATSQGTPTLTLHGSTDPVTWTHPDPRHRWVAADVHCRPCCQVTCPLGTVECMAELSVEQVLDAARTATGGTG